MTDVVFQASDLAGTRRRAFLSAARDGQALLRDTDGFALAMVPLAELEAVTEVGRVAVMLLRAEVGLRRPKPRPSNLGGLGWILFLDEEDRVQCLEELSDAVSVTDATHDVVPLRTCLAEWQATARALADPARRRLLTGPGDDDFVEVGRPA